MLKRFFNLHCFLLVAGILFTVNAKANVNNPDPFESYNRLVFSFNEQADRYLLKPIAKGYKALTPDPLERSVVRVFSNLNEVLNLFNNILQGKLNEAAHNGGRLIINSSLGIVGIFDVASPLGIHKTNDEDFGQTLAVWGVKSGPYLVLPFLGPSTLRDAPALFVDSQLNPIGYIEDVPTRNSVYGVSVVNDRAQLLDAEALISGDTYSFIRDIYLQRRQYLINDGEFVDSFGGYGEFDGSDDYYEYDE